MIGFIHPEETYEWLRDNIKSGYYPWMYYESECSPRTNYETAFITNYVGYNDFAKVYRIYCYKDKYVLISDWDDRKEFYSFAAFAHYFIMECEVI